MYETHTLPVTMKRLVQSVMKDLYPRAEGLPGIEDCDVDTFLEKFTREGNPAMVAGVYAGSVFYALAPVATIGKPLPSFLLSAEDRDRHAYAMATTDSYAARQAVFLVKLVAGLCWGQDPKVRSQMNLEAYPEDPGTFRTH